MKVSFLLKIVAHKMIDVTNMSVTFVFVDETVEGKKVVYLRKDESTAIDKGGPKRQVAGDMMKQMGDVVVKDRKKNACIDCLSWAVQG